MDRNLFLYGTDLAMGIVFACCFVTGAIKLAVLQRVPGLADLVLPSALIASVHDWSGVLLGALVLFHLYLNRGWIAAMTRKVRVRGSG
jgi:hypothetical protein